MAHDATDVSGFFETYRGPQIQGLPKYARLREAFIAAIEDGYFRPGQKLPTEAELARDTPFSLGTVQKALKALVDAGVIVRRQGDGTFVAERLRQMDVPWHCRFFGDDEKTFLPAFPKVVLRKLPAPTGPWSRVLAPTGDTVLQIDRVIRIGGEFAVYSRYFANADKFGRLMEKTDAELERTNFKILVRREYNTPVIRVSQTIRVIEFPKHICRAIGIADGATSMLLEIVASSGFDNPVYFQELYIPPTTRKLYISDSSTLPVALSRPSTQRRKRP